MWTDPVWLIHVSEVWIVFDLQVHDLEHLVHKIFLFAFYNVVPFGELVPVITA